MIRQSEVPCNGCTACCRVGSVMLHPALGDDARQFDCEATPFGYVLRRKADGSCVYLREGGCSIWPNMPGICRAFDCREYVQRGLHEVPGCGDPDVEAAGRERLREK